MADKEIHHVKLYSGRLTQIYSLIFVIIMSSFVAIAAWRLFLGFDEEPIATAAPYQIDLGDEKFPTTIDYTSRWEIMVRVEKPDGVEVRLLDPDDGHLIGTFIEKPPTPTEAVSQ